MQKSLKNTRPMSGLAYPTSDVESYTLNADAHTIQTEIVRGIVLHEQKSLSSERSNSVFSKFPNLADGTTRHRRKTPKWKKSLRAKSPIAKNARMSASTSRESSFRSYRSSRMDRPACSMRVSELAVPSKRQCIESWRANANVLPEVMINRLKERVTDQVPTVKVSDAVNCMKNNKPSSRSRDKVLISPMKKPSRKINKEAMNNKIHAENQTLSEVFGMKIAQALMKPMAITLNSQLQNVSNVISEEIHNLIKNTKMSKTEKATNQRMVRETSEKVTIWIAKILEDSKEKLLEEELKVLKLMRRSTIVEQFVTLIEVSTNEESELEEQEGPVLDILDDLVDKILHQCIRTPSGHVTPEFASICSSDNDEDEADRHSAEENPSQPEEKTVDEDFNRDDVVYIKTDDEDAIENNVKKQLNDVFNSLKRDDGSEIPKDTIQNDIKQQINEVINSLEQDGSEMPILKLGDAIQSEKYKPDIEEKHSNLDVKLEPDVDVLYSNDTQLLHEEQNYDGQKISANEDMSDTPHVSIPDEKENIIPSGTLTPLPSVDKVTDFPISHNEDTDDKKLEDEIFLDTDDIKKIDDDVENATDTNEERTSNVSDAIEIIAGGQYEEKNKKVIFSHENLDPMKEKEDYYPINSKENLLSKDEKLLDNITNSERPNIDFAPPNDHLLSDADESWPEKAPITKPSASVTRSISSMGRIVETEEKVSIALDDDTKDFPETTNPYQGTLENHKDNDNGKNLNSIFSPKTNGLDEHKNDKQQEVSDLQKKPEDLGYLNEIDNKIVLHEPDEEHSVKPVIEVILKNRSSFVVQDAPELPTSREFENLNMSLPEVIQADRSSFVDQDAPELPTSRETENLNMSLPEVIQADRSSFVDQDAPELPTARESENLNMSLPEVIQADKSSFVDQDAPELPTARKSENLNMSLPEVIQADRSSFVDQDAPELPSQRESENISLAEVQQKVCDKNKQKEGTVENTPNEVELEMNALPFFSILSKWQKYDNKTVSLKEYVDSKRADHGKDDTDHGQIDQSYNISEDLPSRKFDYRVHPKTAPAWIRRGQGDPSGSLCTCSRYLDPDANKMKAREREILKCDRDLDFILLKLDKWKHCLSYISKYITTLKHKAALYNVGKNSGTGKLKLVGTDKDVTWRKLNQRAKGTPGLELRRKDSTVKLKISPSPVKYCTTCGRTKSNRIKKLRNRSHSTNFTETKCKRDMRPQCLIRQQQDVSA